MIAFSNVTTAEGFGVANADGFTIYDSANQAVERSAFAAAVVAFSFGSFKVEHPLYVIRGLDRADIEVRIERDYDSDSWRGEVTLG